MLKLLIWVKEHGLGIKPENTAFVAFSIKYKIPEFRQAKINSIAVKLSREAKYLSVILN